MHKNVGILFKCILLIILITESSATQPGDRNQKQGRTL